MDNNGHKMDVSWDVMPIGMHKQNQNPYESLSTGNKMRRSAGQSKVFDNNGSTNKGSAGGTINHNSEYSSVTYGF